MTYTFSSVLVAGLIMLCRFFATIFINACFYYETMLVKEQAQSVVPPHPNSFAGLMEMYEINYIQLHLLLGDMRRLPAGQIARVPGRVPVSLEVREQVQHTSTLMLTYLFGTAQDEETRPDMLVRVYHDSLQAEVISHRCRLSDEMLRYRYGEVDSMLRCRWRMNRFLYKWVAFLRRQGYQFVHE